MKQVILILLLLTSELSIAQKLKESIQGDWVCMKILDSIGKPTVGKFGESNGFLKFSFSKNNLSISQSPFDKGISIPVVFKNENCFDWLPNAVYEIPERIYYVKALDKTHLTLKTKTQNGDSISYHFVNQNQFFDATTNGIIDNGLVIIKHIRLSQKNVNDINKIFEYQITNDTIYLSPSPTFEYYSGGSFGQIFSFYFKLPATFKLDEVSEELILDFDVFKKGAENIKIVKGINQEIDSEVIRVMEKLHKNWKPIEINDSPIKTTSRIHLYFYMTISELNFP